jgi:Ser/Thr protein kinase RdoA (MazF antagonist)
MIPPEVLAVLARYPAPCRPVGAVAALGGAGGRSGSRWWRFAAAGGGELGLRAWPPAPLGPDAARLAAIHGWLAGARALPFVPVPIAGLDGRTWHNLGGRLWELVPWLPGEAEPIPSDRPARLEAGFAALGSLHRALAGCGVGVGTSPNVRARREELDRLARGGLEALARAAGSPVAARWVLLAGRLAGPFAEALRRVEAVRVPLQPCARDMRGCHLLFEGDSVRGLLDFGAMGIDGVATDLARLIEDWLGFDPEAARRGLASYEAVRPLEPGERRLIAPLARAGSLLAGANWLRWGCVERRPGVTEADWVAGVERSVGRLAGWVAAGETGIVG